MLSKLLNFSLFIILTLLALMAYPPSEIFAKVVPVCTDSSVELRGSAVGTKDAKNDINCPNDEDICYKDRTTGLGTQYDCYKKSGTTTTGTTTGTTTTTITTPANPTKGSGLQCDSGSGKKVDSGGDGILTAIGCVPVQPQILTERLLRYGTLAAGGVAFLLMLLAGLQMITAEGNPNTIKTAQERFYSAIIGLLLIVFSVLLMQVIGVDLLGLKGFDR